VFSKGASEAAYSGFEGADDAGTPLAAWLRERGVDALDVAGIATDYCVQATALDAAREGFATRVLLHLTAGVDPVTTGEAVAALRGAGGELAGAAESNPRARRRKAPPRPAPQGHPRGAARPPAPGRPAASTRKIPPRHQRRPGSDRLLYWDVAPARGVAP